MLRLIASFLFLVTVPMAAQEATIAVIGLRHSHVWGHLPKMIEGDPARLVGLAEDIPELVEEAKELGVDDSLVFSNYEEMLDKTRPQIVWAFVENNRHLEIAKACAQRGIHVIFEKPLAATLAEAVAIRDLARETGIRVMTNYQMAWWPENYAAKAQADSGAVGTVWRLRGIVGHGGPGSEGARNSVFFDWLTDPEENGAGALMDFGCYNALWSLWYLGRPESVYAHVNHLRPERFPKVEDNSTMILSYENGVGLFEGSWDLPRSFQDLEVFGLDGSLYMTSRGVELRAGRGEAEQVAVNPLPEELAEPIAYMVHAIQADEPLEGLVALDINVDVVEIIEAAKRSVETGEAIPLPLSQ